MTVSRVLHHPAAMAAFLMVCAPACALDPGDVDLEGDPVFRSSVPGAEGELNAAVGDFDGDGNQDIAVGAPGYGAAICDAATDCTQGTSVVPCPGWGAVQIWYDSTFADTLRRAPDQLWDRTQSGSSEPASCTDRFGYSLAAGDLNGDGVDDLVVGVPGERINSRNAAGSVHLLFGSAAGIGSSGNQVIHQNTSGVNGASERLDIFGAAVSLGDYNCDGNLDLAVGVPGEAIGSIEYAGAVNVLYGGPTGISTANDQFFSQNTSGIAGGSETNDHLGGYLASADFNGDGCDDLAIAATGEAIGTATASGAVNVLYGGAAGLSSSGDQMWHQNSSGIAGVAVAGDYFGHRLRAEYVDTDAYADLVLDVVGEVVGTTQGAVATIRGGPTGLTSTGNTLVAASWAPDAEPVTCNEWTSCGDCDPCSGPEWCCNPAPLPGGSSGEGCDDCIWDISDADQYEP